MVRTIILLIILLPLPVGAETITVRSGDHAGFSRLVFPFSNSVGWQLGRVGDAYELRIQNTDMTFDLSKVFQKITRKRIRDLAETHGQNHSGIVIELGCECHADAFEFRPGLLVVDIKDGPPDENAAFEQAFSGDEIINLPATLGANLEPQGSISGILPASGAPHEISQRPSEPVKLPLARSNEKSAETVSLPLLMETRRKTPEVLLPSFKPPEIREMGNDFLSVIAKAATEGLLTPNARIPYPEQAGEKRAPNIDANPDMENEGSERPSEETAERRLPVRVRSSIDDASPVGNEHQIQLNANGKTCLPGNVFDLPSWGDPSAPYESVILARADLVGEFDQVLPEDVSTLAMAYLYAGFGVEAKNVISAFSQKPEHAEILLAMAEIMDDGWAFERAELSNQISCETEGALWAALSLPEFPRGLKMNRQAIQRAFSALPAHTRRHLGPTLVNRFLASGDEEMAHALKSAILRVADAEDSRIVLMEADFPRDRDAIRRTERKLEDIVRSNQVLSAEALRKLMETKLEHGDMISDELIEMSAALASERGATETGKVLLGLNIQALASRGRLASALREWRRYSSHSSVSRKEADELLERLLDFATKEESSQKFLIFIFGAKQHLLQVEAAGAAFEAAAARLIELGFPDLGSDFLEMVQDDKGQQEMLKARAAIAMDLPEVAMDLLAEARSRDALLLKAKAAESLSNFDLAATLYNEAGNQSAFQSMLLKMNRWNRLHEASSGPRKLIAEMATDNMKLHADENANTKHESLLDYRQLLKGSEYSLATIENLIKAIPLVPDDPVSGSPDI